MGRTIDCGEERLRDLMTLHDRYVAERRVIVMSELFDWIVKQPARRFYVSEYRAAAVVGKILRGENLGRMRRLKRDMFHEIARRVMVSQREGESLASAVGRVIYEPAPSFYLTASSARIYLMRYKKTWRERKLRKMRHLS